MHIKTYKHNRDKKGVKKTDTFCSIYSSQTNPFIIILLREAVQLRQSHNLREGERSEGYGENCPASLRI